MPSMGVVVVVVAVPYCVPLRKVERVAEVDMFPARSWKSCWVVGIGQGTVAQGIVAQVAATPGTPSLSSMPTYRYWRPV